MQLMPYVVKKQTYPFSIMEASRDPTLSWYLHKEEGGKPLPELHLCLTAEVPAGQGTDLDTAKAEQPAWLSRQGAYMDNKGTQPKGTCNHLSQPGVSGQGPYSPLLLLMFLCLVHHCEAPAAEEGQMETLASPQRPPSPGARDGAQKPGPEPRGTVQGLLASTAHSGHSLFLSQLTPASQALGSLYPCHPTQACPSL